jgi:flagellar biosynthesis chaperone FliJ
MVLLKQVQKEFLKAEKRRAQTEMDEILRQGRKGKSLNLPGCRDSSASCL